LPKWKLRPTYMTTPPHFNDVDNTVDLWCFRNRFIVASPRLEYPLEYHPCFFLTCETCFGLDG
jgi:hypothetical protein